MALVTGGQVSSSPGDAYPSLQRGGAGGEEERQEERQEGKEQEEEERAEGEVQQLVWHAKRLEQEDTTGAGSNPVQALEAALVVVHLGDVSLVSLMLV